MADYGRPLSFGISIDPTAADFTGALVLARQADEEGLDHLAVQDHPYLPGHLDVWTMLTYLLARTHRISVMPDVIDLQLRPPAILAKAAASLAAMAGGRVHLGVGGGASARGVASMGGQPRSGADLVEFTEEAVGIIRRALAGGAIRAGTRQHPITGYRAGPVPPQPVEVWLGGRKPKMLAATGRSSQGWVCPLNIYIPPEVVPGLQSQIDAAAAGAGRDPREIRRICNVLGAIGPSREGKGLVGSTGLWIDTLSDWVVGLGFDTFVFWPTADAHGQLSAFASEVVPAVRRQVSERRGGA